MKTSAPTSVSRPTLKLNGLFHTPASQDELMTWVNRLPPQDGVRISALTAAMMAWNLAAVLTGTSPEEDPPATRKAFTTDDVYATLECTEAALPQAAAAVVARIVTDQQDHWSDEVNAIAGVAEQLGLITTIDATGDDSIDAEVAAFLAGKVRYSEITLTIRCVRNVDGASDFGDYLANLALDDENSTEYGRIVLEATPAEREL